MSETGRIGQVTQARQQAMGDTAARKRIAALLDTGSFVELDGFVKAGVVCGYGAVMGTPVAVFAQDSAELDGAVGKAHAGKINKIYELALKTGVPVLGIYDSRGARLEDGNSVLAAYGNMLGCVSSLSGVVPQISVVLGPCAGMSAMLACGADFVVMSKAAELFMAAPGKDQLAGTAEAAAKAGVAHVVCDGETDAINCARKLMTMLPLNNLAPAPISDYAAPTGDGDQMRAACESPMAAAKLVDSLVDVGSAVELLADFGPSAYTALATMAGSPCGFVATSGEALCRDACAKIAKLVSVCDAYQIPVLTFINTEGLASTAQDELCGSIRDMARMAHIYAEATTPKIAIITGPTYGSAYVALSSADYTIAWPSAVIAPLKPETAVAFLHGDDIDKNSSRAQLEAKYIQEDASPYTAAENGFIDDVVDPAVTRPAILSALDLLSAKRVSKNPKKHSNIPL